VTTENDNNKQLDRIVEDIRDIKLSQERLRIEFVAGFTAKDIHNLEMATLREQIAQSRQEHKDDMTRLEKQREKDEQQQIGKNERLWLRVGSIVALFSLIIAILQYLHVH